MAVSALADIEKNSGHIRLPTHMEWSHSLLGTSSFTFVVSFRSEHSNVEGVAIRANRQIGVFLEEIRAIF